MVVVVVLVKGETLRLKVWMVVVVVLVKGGP